MQTESGGIAYGEMAHLYCVKLGNPAYSPPGDATCAGGPQSGWGPVNTGPFTNMQFGVYWSGLEYLTQSSGSAWDFFTDLGYQWLHPRREEYHAVAVRPGDVAASVPEPQTLALTLLALGGAALARNRRWS